VRRIGLLLTGLLLTLVLVGAGCSRTPDPEPASVPAGFTAWGGGWCAAAFPSDWQEDAAARVRGGPVVFKGADGWGFIDSSTELEARRPDAPLPESVGYYAGTQLRVTSRQAVDVPGADRAFRLRLDGANGRTHLAVYGHDARDSKGCWLVVSPADTTAEQVAQTLAVGEG
jgi:hypothetical protein